MPDDWWQNGKVWDSTDLGAGILRLVGRLAPGATPQSARAELEAVSARLREGHAELARSGFALAVDPLHDAVVSRVRTTLWLLLGAAGSVLLIACANVANLQLVRGRRRAREIAVRLALGASRRRVVRLLLAEALLLAFLGGALGVVLGSAGLDLLLLLRPSDLPRADAIRLTPPCSPSQRPPASARRSSSGSCPPSRPLGGTWPWISTGRDRRSGPTDAGRERPSSRPRSG